MFNGRLYEKKDEKMSNQNINSLRIGQLEVISSRIGVGAMTWGDPLLIPRLNPARIGYGLANSKEEQKKAVEVSIAAA